MTRPVPDPARVPMVIGCALAALHCSGENPGALHEEAPLPSATAGRGAATPNAAATGAAVPSPDVATPVSTPQTGEGPITDENAGLSVVDDAVIVADPADVCAAKDTGQARGVLERLGRDSVHNDAPVRRTVYSWTRAAQIEELRADPTLMTRLVNAQGERGRAGDILAGAAATDGVAAVLNQERFARTRHAWANSWATIRGWTGEDYGDRLLAIALRDEAWVASMRPLNNGAIEWSFYDMSGAVVSQEAFLRSPERLGAIYFVDDRDPTRCGGEFQTTGSVLREYILCNEAMIERYAAFTDEIRLHLAEELTTVRELQRVVASVDCKRFAAAQTCWKEDVMQTWSSGELKDVVGAYGASLAFPNPLYAPTPINLTRLISRLEAVPLDEPILEHVYPTLE